MKLLIDIGNSRVKWARSEPGRYTFGGAFATDASSLAEACESQMAALPRPEAVLVSNVAGTRAGRLLADWASARWVVPVRFVRSEASALGVVNAYPNPAQLGVDRWLGLIGAWRTRRDACCIVSAGTALTIDLLDAEGRHRGGVIGPGLAMMRAALASLEALGGAAESCDGFFCNRTGPALSSGILHSAVGLIRESQARAARLLATEPELLLTGGDAETLRPYLETPVRLVPHLVLEGLHAVAERMP
ncbi:MULTISPECIES: type III pantothenate kinase [Methylococcus]|uniref:Type III pantothenate kinase n=1 Tax=Methylococcus capsulatus TaxID=414 RepID=A0AA35UJV6_METCP|nr:type III pantothenate kinase [Methylococcus capsulatus]QXP87570.1 type III pantothenate kinase [Methylococcus capsulatus]QXP92690.1 type III pantothenate kinase [Methylococcus capsulatus]UQN12584.1 type III pantothenate kinase [Methylococcus capsulatus]CAI8870020.1 Type III pantothenate kinase [Methylococcus capsulatus]